MSDVTGILSALEKGDPSASDRLLPLVYEELRRLAALKLAREQAGQTLQPTALVHEAYLRLVASPLRKQGESLHWQSARHFFAAAAESMRRILVENARRKKRQKHGGQMTRRSLDPFDVAAPETDEELLGLDEALHKLAEADSVAAQLVQLRYFAGMTLPQIAEAMTLSPRTADRLWAYARAFLHSEIYGEK